jgi:hypothetical protein
MAWETRRISLSSLRGALPSSGIVDLRMIVEVA